MSSTTFRNIIQSAGRQLQKRVYWKYGINVSAKNYLDDETFKSVTLKYNTFPTDGTVCDYMELQLSIDITTSENYDSTRPVYLEVLASAGGVQATETYGPYYLKENPSYDASSKTYTHKFYDEMIKTMIPYEPLAVTYPITVNNYFSALITQLGITSTITLSVTGTKTLSEDPYYGVDDDGNPASMGYTYRDVLSDILQANGILGEIQAGTLSAVGFGQVAVDLDDDILKNVNIDIDKYFRVNCLTLTRANRTDNITYKNDSSISSYGKHELVIADNMILNDSDREDYIQALYNQWENKNWNYCDLELTGFGGFDKLERVRIKTNGNTYFTYAFNNEITIDESYNEILYVPEEELAIEDGSYSYTSTEEKTDKNAEIIINKKIGEVDIRGKAIKLTANDITIESTNFNVDTDGNIMCNKATMKDAQINGGSIELVDDGTIGSNIPKMIIYSDEYLNTLSLGNIYDFYKLTYWFSGDEVSRFSNNQVPIGEEPTILQLETPTYIIKYNYITAFRYDCLIEYIYDKNTNDLISRKIIREVGYDIDTNEYYIMTSNDTTIINEQAEVTEYDDSSSYGYDVLSHFIYIIKNSGAKAILQSNELQITDENNSKIIKAILSKSYVEDDEPSLLLSKGTTVDEQALLLTTYGGYFYKKSGNEYINNIELDGINSVIKAKDKIVIDGDNGFISVLGSISVNGKDIINKSNITMGLNANKVVSGNAETLVELSRIAYTGSGLTASSDGGVLVGAGISAVLVSAQACISAFSGNALRRILIKRKRGSTLSNIARSELRLNTSYTGNYNSIQIIGKITGVQEGDILYMYSHNDNPSSGTSSTTIYGSNIDTYLTVQELE